MYVIEVEGWTDCSTGRPRPAFTVKLERYLSVSRGSPEEELAKELAASAAAARLERELERVSDEASNLDLWVHCRGRGYSKYALYAMLYLAAARANVNPAYIKFVYSGEPAVKIGLSYAFHGLLKSIFDPLENVLRPLTKGVVKVILHAPPKSTREALDAIINLISRISDKPDKITRAMLVSLLVWLYGDVKWFHDKVIDGIAFQKVKDFYLKAAEEARDPDVKRLAEILAEIADNAVEMAHTLEYKLGGSYRLDRLIDDLAYLPSFKEGKEQLLKVLAEARDAVSVYDLRVEQLTPEADEIIEKRLERRGPLLDMELESEEEIKRRLLEA